MARAALPEPCSGGSRIFYTETPRRVDSVELDSAASFTHNVRDDTAGLDPDAASFTYEIYQQSGMLAASGSYFTSDHLNVIDITQIAPPGVRFGTVIFDFTAARGGWVSARYSAFGRFSVELEAACRDVSIF